MLNFKKLKIKSPLPKFTAYAIVLLALIFAGSVSFVLAQVTSSTKRDTTASKTTVVRKSYVNPTPKQTEKKLSITQTPQTTKVAISQLSPTPTVSISTSQTGSNPTVIQNSSAQPTTPPTVTVAENKVSVSINGTSSFEVKVAVGSNQCDVLSKASQDGKISLNMRYDNSLGSNAVYQINGLGRDNSVWWTYTVNGQSPSQGCSFVKANNGDNVEWKYIGS